MQYLIGQMLTCLLIAGLFGLLIGWLFWGMLLRRLRERSADLEQRVSKLRGYASRLADVEATHAAFVASKNEEDAKCKARIAELEPIAAKTPELEKSLALKTAEWERLRSEMDGKAAQIAALQANLSDLETLASAKDGEIAEHVRSHASKDARLASFVKRVAEIEPVAQRVPMLEAQIDQHVDEHREKDRHLGQIMREVDELKPIAAQVPELRASLAENYTHLGALVSHVEKLQPLAGHVPDLQAQVKQHEAAHAEKNARIVELEAAAALVPSLTAQLGQQVEAQARKDARIAELVPLAAATDDLQSRLQNAEHEYSLVTQQLRAAEMSATGYENEISELQDRVLTLKTQVENAKVAPVPLRVRVAAAGAGMGFYDVNEGAPREISPAQDHAREFEKRIKELRNIESSKDDEIARLRAKVAELEAAPDPDTKRQILFAGKTAELTHLRGLLNTLFQPLSHEDVAVRAFSYYENRGFSDGSHMEDWLRAERDAHFSRLGSLWESTRTGATF